MLFGEGGYSLECRWIRRSEYRLELRGGDDDIKRWRLSVYVYDEYENTEKRCKATDPKVLASSLVQILRCRIQRNHLGVYL